MNKFYIVCLTNKNLLWNSTTESWEREDFDTFTEEQKAIIKLPEGGKWENPYDPHLDRS